MRKSDEPKPQNASRSWWIKLLVQPLLFLACGAILFIGLGVAQRWGLISAGHVGHRLPANDVASDTRYICPMMCTPPRATPGRCPVCGMELVPVADVKKSGDSRSVYVDPVARRVANISTALVKSMPITRTIRTIGEIAYDEGTLKTISAYVDGRLERLYADYTGVAVRKGDQLALVYSPQLYSAQVELLLARNSNQARRSPPPPYDLYAMSRQRLIELGMTEPQIAELEQAGEANSRLELCAPISGTVIEKLAVEGQYIKEGQAIYRLADLSEVWLMLELFPEDASAIRYGQSVQAEVQSLRGSIVKGRVAFVDPNVNPATRTVGVRVVVKNDDGRMRIGDYAKATIEVPHADQRESQVFDPELANKWISPRHPQIISAAPGKCPRCGIDLIPAEKFGFTDQPSATSNVLAVPRDAVLMAGSNSVIYVETVPGRFELRRVVLGAEFDGQVVIRDGVREGEQVATRGNFLIDSQMQLAGNPSLIDPLKFVAATDRGASSQVTDPLSGLSPEDRHLVESQQICPVTKLALGAMGPPLKVEVMGHSVFICCENCRSRLVQHPEKYLAQPSKADATGSGVESDPAAEEVR